MGAPEPDPVPRDMPDQPARSDDPWDLPGDRPADRPEDRSADRQSSENPGGPTDENDENDQDGGDGGDGGDDRDLGDELPDTDEAGTGPRGAPRTGTVHPEHPGPDESPG